MLELSVLYKGYHARWIHIGYHADIHRSFPLLVQSSAAHYPFQSLFAGLKHNISGPLYSGRWHSYFFSMENKKTSFYKEHCILIFSILLKKYHSIRGKAFQVMVRKDADNEVLHYICITAGHQ